MSHAVTLQAGGAGRKLGLALAVIATAQLMVVLMQGYGPGLGAASAPLIPAAVFVAILVNARKAEASATEAL